MILYKTSIGNYLEEAGRYYRLPEDSIDALWAHEDLVEYVSAAMIPANERDPFNAAQLEAPIDNQEVWAAGVTYYRSRNARIEESKSAGGGDFYDRVYSAERPELFFKAIGKKVAGPNGTVRIRSDATWSVPEPELALVINSRGEIIGYTAGNDMSSRDIEALNPLYLPQAKVYDRSCALGPGVLIQKAPMPASTQIKLEILRNETLAFSGNTSLAELKRSPATLVDYLFRDQTFPYGCFLLTGTGIVPPDDFSLKAGDQIRISISSIGTLVNHVA